MRKKRNATRGSVKKSAVSVKKRDKKNMIVMLVGGLVIIYFVYTLITQQIAINKKNQELENLQTQIAEANEESDKLKTEIENLSDPEYIEKIAREKLGLVRPNERVFVDSNKSENNSGK